MKPENENKLMKVLDKILTEKQNQLDSILLCEADLEDIQNEIYRREKSIYHNPEREYPYWDGGDVDDLMKYLFSLNNNSFEDKIKFELFLKVFENCSLAEFESALNKFI